MLAMQAAVIQAGTATSEACDAPATFTRAMRRAVTVLARKLPTVAVTIAAGGDAYVAFVAHRAPLQFAGTVSTVVKFRLDHACGVHALVQEDAFTAASWIRYDVTAAPPSAASSCHDTLTELALTLVMRMLVDGRGAAGTGGGMETPLSGEDASDSPAVLLAVTANAYVTHARNPLMKAADVIEAACTVQPGNDKSP